MVYQLPYSQEETIRRGPWLEEEDEQLVMFVTSLGERRWDSLARVSGLKRSGKSCRMRWLNYLRPSLKHGPITEEEERIILQLHALWGNKWSKIARRLPGRTDNDIKNYWKTHLRRKAQAQEHAKISGRRGDVGEDLLCKSNEGVKEVNEQTLETQKETSDGSCGIEDFGTISSPYETRISDWISNIPTNQIQENCLDDYSSSSSDSNSIGSSTFFGSWWVQENRDGEEFSCSLWT